MTAVEEIEAAIARLTYLQAIATPGTWTATWGSATVPAADSLGSEDADLIVTLHRTIDAQLAILRNAFRAYSKYVSDIRPPLDHDIAALDLARAINGTFS